MTTSANDHNRIDLSRLSTEQRNPATEEIDTVATRELVRIMNDEDAKVAAAVDKEADAIATAIDGISDRIARGGRLVYIGAGTSGRLGVLDASECPPTYNTPPELVVGLIAGDDFALRHSIEHVEDDPEQGAAALRNVDLAESDAVVGIAASGRTPYVLGAMRYARDIGALTVGVTNSAGSELAAAVDIAIAPIVGPEVVTGSTRLKSGTAQKMVLNMLSTGAMIKLGKTYGNLMVDVQAKNSKLKRRAIGIVREGTGISDAEAEVALVSADGNVKRAIVASRLGVSPDEAQQKLDAAHGRVRVALGEAPA